MFVIDGDEPLRTGETPPNAAVLKQNGKPTPDRSVLLVGRCCCCASYCRKICPIALHTVLRAGNHQPPALTYRQYLVRYGSFPAQLMICHIEARLWNCRQKQR